MSILIKQKGAVTIMAAVMLPVILAFTGIAVDIGRLYTEKAKLQNLADAAATSALVEMRKTDLIDKNIGKTMKYKKGSGTLTTTIPIGAISDNSDVVVAIRDAVNAAAYDYLEKNGHLGTFNDSKSKVETVFYTTKTSDPVVVTDDTKTYNERYYYEVILSKEYPVFFARVIHPKDVMVRAGAVCMIDIEEVIDKTPYEKALEKWGKLSWNELRDIPPSERLDMDILALTNIAKNIIGRNKEFMEKQLGLDIIKASGSDLLLGHYLEGMDATGAVNTSYTPNNKVAGDKIMSWLQGDYTSNKPFEGEATQQRYLFSDYAIGLKSNGELRTGDNLKDGIKLKFRSQEDPNNPGQRIVTEVKIAINPKDGQNGSAPLAVKATLNTDNSDVSWAGNSTFTW